MAVLEEKEFQAEFVHRMWMNKNHQLLRSIPATSPAMTERERLELQKRIMRSDKRRLAFKWPRAANLPE